MTDDRRGALVRVLLCAGLLACGVLTLSLVDAVEQGFARHVEHARARASRRDMERVLEVYQHRRNQIKDLLEDAKVEEDVRMAAGRARGLASVLPAGQRAPTSAQRDNAVFHTLKQDELDAYRKAVVSEEYELHKRVDELSVRLAAVDRTLGNGHVTRGDGGSASAFDRWLDDVVREGSYAHAVFHLGNLLAIFLGYAALIVGGVVFVGALFGDAAAAAFGLLKDWAKSLGTGAAVVTVAGSVAAGTFAWTSVLPQAQPDTPPNWRFPSAVATAGASSAALGSSGEAEALFAVPMFPVWKPDDTLQRRVAAAMEAIAAREPVPPISPEDRLVAKAVADVGVQVSRLGDRLDRRSQNLTIDAPQLEQLTAVLEEKPEVIAHELAAGTSRVVGALDAGRSTTEKLIPPVDALSDSTAALREAIGCSLEYERWRVSRSGWSRFVHWFTGAKGPC